MKRIFKLTALIAAILTLAACNKEKDEPTNDRYIVYTVDERTTTVHLTTEEEFDALLESFCDYAESGSFVSFHNARRGAVKSLTAKSASNFSTTNRAEMKRWMRQMEEAGKTVTVTYDSSTGTYNGTAYANAPEPQPDSLWIDLGLPSGLLWARYNVGAAAPEEYGSLFAWGETMSKHPFFWNNYAFCGGTEEERNDSNFVYENNLIKYCSLSSYGYHGYCDTLTILLSEDDAATANWGDGARTPTIEDWEELIANCTYVQQSNGFSVVGPNGNAIFFPAGEEYYEYYIFLPYMSSSLYDEMPCWNKGVITYENNSLQTCTHYRYAGSFVRPVKNVPGNK